MSEKALGVLPEHSIKIRLAVEVVSLINSFATPYEKALCLKKAVNVVTKNLMAPAEDGDGSLLSFFSC